MPRIGSSFGVVSPPRRVFVRTGRIGRRTTAALLGLPLIVWTAMLAKDAREPSPAPPEPAPPTWYEAHGLEPAPMPPADTIAWFDGRPARPVRAVYLRVTAYAPDARSCGDFADGLTASLKSVWTNNGHLVAADTRVLPFGTMLSIPGYAGDRIVPVLDRGGAIKGGRLDVMFPTHRAALEWGVRRLPVVIWEPVPPEALARSGETGQG